MSLVAHARRSISHPLQQNGLREPVVFMTGAIDGGRTGDCLDGCVASLRVDRGGLSVAR